MKSLFVTTMFCCFISIGFAQKIFKPIHFTSWCDYRPSIPLDGISEHRGPLQQESGIIEIKQNESEVTITPNGGTAAHYKITQINDEMTYSTGKKSVVIYYINENGKTMSFAISRNGSTMEFIKYNYGKTILYNCDYLTEL